METKSTLANSFNRYVTGTLNENSITNLFSFQEIDDINRWNQASITISVLPSSVYAIKKLLEFAHLFREKMQFEEIQNNFKSFCTKTRKTISASHEFSHDIASLESIVCNSTKLSPIAQNRENKI